MEQSQFILSAASKLVTTHSKFNSHKYFISHQQKSTASYLHRLQWVVILKQCRLVFLFRILRANIKIYHPLPETHSFPQNRPLLAHFPTTNSTWQSHTGMFLQILWSPISLWKKMKIKIIVSRRASKWLWKRDNGFYQTSVRGRICHVIPGPLLIT